MQYGKVKDTFAFTIAAILIKNKDGKINEIKFPPVAPTKLKIFY